MYGEKVKNHRLARWKKEGWKRKLGRSYVDQGARGMQEPIIMRRSLAPSIICMHQVSGCDALSLPSKYTDILYVVKS